MRPDRAAPGGEMRSMTEGAADVQTEGYGSVAFQGVGTPDSGHRHGFLPHDRAEIRDFVDRTLEIAKADLKLGLSDLPGLLVPWVLFCLCLMPIALLVGRAVAYCGFALAVCIVGHFIFLSYGQGWRALSLACMVASVLGVYLGFYDRFRYLDPYQIYTRSPSYADVSPSEDPAAYRDAGFMSFTPDSRVDASMGLGYRSGDTWCVAPVLGREQLAWADAKPGDELTANFWAVGQNCCRDRGTFDCGDPQHRSLRGGLVILDVDRGDEVLMTYKLAIEAASQTYGLIVPHKPVLISWGEMPEPAISAIFGDARNFVIYSVCIMFAFVPFMATLLACFGYPLTTRSESLHWHPSEFEQMTFFGVNYMGREYSRELQLSLLNGRCYWSGEVIYDYMFHIANKHMYFGCLFCHPAHPFSKWERLCVCIMVSLFIVFPVSAISVEFGQFSTARTVFLLFFVTLPRNILKLYMIQIAQQDTLLELEEGYAAETAVTKKAFQWELTFLFTAFIICVITCGLCASYIVNTSPEGLATVLWCNCDGIVFAMIVEPLIDTIVPFVGLDDLRGSWTLGFFGRWRQERDHYAKTGIAMDLMPKGRQQITDSGPGLFDGLSGFENTPEERVAADVPRRDACSVPGFRDACNVGGARDACKVVRDPCSTGPGGEKVPCGGPGARNPCGTRGGRDVCRTRDPCSGLGSARDGPGPFERPLFRDVGTEILMDPEARLNRERAKRKAGCGKLTKSACGSDWGQLFDPVRKPRGQVWQSTDPFATQPMTQPYSY